MWEKIKTAARWVYDWITVLVASLVGVPSLLLQLLDSVGAVNIAPLVGPDLALKIVTGVAIVKAILAVVESTIKARQQ